MIPKEIDKRNISRFLIRPVTKDHFRDLPANARRSWPLWIGPAVWLVLAWLICTHGFFTAWNWDSPLFAIARKVQDKAKSDATESVAMSELPWRLSLYANVSNMTTVGASDVIPINRAARAIFLLDQLMGLFLLATTVALLAKSFEGSPGMEGELSTDGPSNAELSEKIDVLKGVMESYAPRSLDEEQRLASLVHEGKQTLAQIASMQVQTHVDALLIKERVARAAYDLQDVHRVCAELQHWLQRTADHDHYRARFRSQDWEELRSRIQRVDAAVRTVQQDLHWMDRQRRSGPG